MIIPTDGQIMFVQQFTMEQSGSTASTTLPRRKNITRITALTEWIVFLSAFLRSTPWV